MCFTERYFLLFSAMIHSTVTSDKRLSVSYFINTFIIYPILSHEKLHLYQSLKEGGYTVFTTKYKSPASKYYFYFSQRIMMYLLNSSYKRNRSIREVTTTLSDSRLDEELCWRDAQSYVKLISMLGRNSTPILGNTDAYLGSSVRTL